MDDGINPSVPDTPEGHTPEAQQSPVQGETHTPDIMLSRRGLTRLEDCVALTLIARVSCPQFCNLTGTTVLLQSSEGDEWEVELSAFNGVENETCEFLVKTGTAPGSYSWVARYSNAAEGGPSHAEVSSSLSFDFRPHALSLAVWDLPSPVISGETIFVKVGAKCGNDCPLEGYPLRLCDEKGVSLASVTLGSEPWEGSQALYWAPASFKAPKETGTYTYHVHTDASKDHGAARGEFSFYVAQKPGCTVSIVVKDKESEAFLPLATVALHPYSACTDEAGYASVPAVVGQAKLTVKAADYESRQLDLVVTGDTSLVVMLTAKPKYEGDF